MRRREWRIAIMFTNDRFAAFVRCIEAFIEAAGGNQALEAAHDFLRGFRDLSADLNSIHPSTAVPSKTRALLGQDP